MSVPESIAPVAVPPAGRNPGEIAPVPARCLWAWRLWCGAAVLVAGGGAVALVGLSGPVRAGAWGAIFLVVAGWLLAGVHRELGLNHPPGQTARPFPTLGAATHLTLARAVGTAALAACAIGPQGLALPAAVLYTLIAFGDAVDGAVARASGRTSALGAWLDVRVDSAALLAAALVLVLQGRAWPVFLLVGLLRPLFLGALELRRRWGLPVEPLRSTGASRAVAGAVMGYLAVALFPLYPGPAARLAGLCFLAALLVTYSKDWLAVTGRRAAAERVASLVRGARPWTRAGAGLALVTLAAGWGDVLGDPGKLLVAVCGLAVLLGLLGRVAALVGLLTLGAAYQGTAAVGGPVFAAGLVLAAAAFFTGPGAHALWSPDERIVRLPGATGEPPTGETAP